MAWRKNVLDLGIQEYPVKGEIAIRSVQLKNYHADPADRIIMATAIEHNCKLVTSDKSIIKWEGELDRWDARK